MLAGKHPFAGHDDRSALGALENNEPDWNVLPPSVPDNISTLVRQCLERDRTARISDMSLVQQRLTIAAPPAVTGLIIAERPVTMAPPTGSVSSAILDGVAAWVQKSPRIMRLFSGLGRRIASILPVARNQFVVLGADEVRETLVRGSDFELGTLGGPKM